jgi:hypothetical protein
VTVISKTPSIGWAIYIFLIWQLFVAGVASSVIRRKTER